MTEASYRDKLAWLARQFGAMIDMDRGFRMAWMYAYSIDARAKIIMALPGPIRTIANQISGYQPIIYGAQGFLAPSLPSGLVVLFCDGAALRVFNLNEMTAKSANEEDVNVLTEARNAINAV